MRDVDEAIGALRTISGLEELELDSDGQVQLTFDDDVPLGIVKVDDGAIEVFSAVPSSGVELTAARLMAILSANLLGSLTGSARIGLDQRDETLVLCQRIDLELYDAVRFEKCILDFLIRASFLRSEDGRQALLGPEIGASVPASGELFIRA